jgi:hypothetical protein
MRKIFSIIFFLGFSVYPAWQQQEFVIGTYADPSFTGDPTTDLATLQLVKNAGFNTLTGYPGYYDCNAAAGKASWYGWYSAFGYGTNPNVCASYRLDLLASIGGLKTFIGDENIISDYNSNSWRTGSTPAVVSTINNGTLPGINPAFTAQEKNCLLGYLMPDEENSKVVNNIMGYGVDHFIKPVQDAFYNKLPDLTCLVNFAEHADDISTLQKDYSDFASDASTRIVCYDYYLFDDNNGTNVNGYFKMGASKVLYYWTLKMVAQTIKGKNISMWGFAGNVEHYCYNADGTTVNRHHVNLDIAQLGYVSYAHILYGAKGILYYSYDPVQYSYDATTGKLSEQNLNAPSSFSPVYNPSTYSTLQKINNRIKKIGQNLMSLQWVSTIHGAATDPCSNENSLDVLKDNSTPFYYKTSSGDAFQHGTGASAGWKPDSLAIGLFKGGAFDYLLILNKSLYMSSDKKWHETDINNTKYIVKSHVYPRVFDKDNGGWMPPIGLYNSSNNTTSFELKIPSGDMQMVWLGPANIVPIINLMLKH